MNKLFKQEVSNTWKVSNGEHLINLIPYIVGSKNPNAKKGEPAFNLVLNVHGVITGDEFITIQCLKNWSKYCPICSLHDKLEYNDPLRQELKTKKYGFYNVIVLDSKEEEEKGVRIFSSPYHLFERQLLNASIVPNLDQLDEEYEEATGYDNEDEEYEEYITQFKLIDFIDPTDGKSIAFTKTGVGWNTKYANFTFPDRKTEISNAILDATYCLDELIYQPTTKELYELVINLLVERRKIKCTTI